MRRLIICTGHAYMGTTEGGSDEKGEKVETCLLIWSYAKKDADIKKLAEEAAGDETDRPATGKEYKHSYKVYHYVRLNTKDLGLRTEAPPASYLERSNNGSGALVSDITLNSPAYNAEIFKGDVLVSINDIPYYHDRDFKEYKYGEENKVVIYRDGKTISKNIYIPS